MLQKVLPLSASFFDLSHYRHHVMLLWSEPRLTPPRELWGQEERRSMIHRKLSALSIRVNPSLQQLWCDSFIWAPLRKSLIRWQRQSSSPGMEVMKAGEMEIPWCECVCVEETGLTLLAWALTPASMCQDQLQNTVDSADGLDQGKSPSKVWIKTWTSHILKSPAWAKKEEGKSALY